MGNVYVSQPNAANCTKTTALRISNLFSQGKSFLQFTFLLILSSLLVANSVSAQATITTDKLDYLPGEVAHISGNGWVNDQNVNVLFKEEPDYPDFHSYNVQVGADGTWQIDYPIELRHLGVKFTVLGTGVQSGDTASTIFYDGALAITTTLLNKATYCRDQEMIVYFTTSGTIAGFNSTNFSAQIGNPGGQFPSNSIILTTKTAPVLISSDGLFSYWRMGVTVPIINSGNGNRYAIRVNYTSIGSSYPEVSGTSLEQVRNAPLVIYNSVASFNLTVSGNACTTGATIAMSGAEVGVSYQLLRNDIAVGTPKIGLSCGTNSVCNISFTNITLAGTYKVEGSINGGCTNTMAGLINITNSASLAPGALDQSFCSSSDVTVANLVPNNLTNRWYNSLFQPLTSSTFLSTGF